MKRIFLSLIAAVLFSFFAPVAQAELNGVVKVKYKTSSFYCGLYSKKTLRAGKYNRRGKFKTFRKLYKDTLAIYNNTGADKSLRLAKRYLKKLKRGRKACSYKFRLKAYDAAVLMIEEQTVSAPGPSASNYLRKLNTVNQVEAVFSNSVDPLIRDLYVDKSNKKVYVSFQESLALRTGAVDTVSGCKVFYFDIPTGVPFCIDSQFAANNDYDSSDLGHLSSYQEDEDYIYIRVRDEEAEEISIRRYNKSTQLTDTMITGDRIRSFAVGADNAIFLAIDDTFGSFTDLVKVDENLNRSDLLVDFQAGSAYRSLTSGHYVVGSSFPSEKAGLYQVDLQNNTLSSGPIIGNSSITPMPSLLDCDSVFISAYCLSSDFLALHTLYIHSGGQDYVEISGDVFKVSGGVGVSTPALAGSLNESFSFDDKFLFVLVSGGAYANQLFTNAASPGSGSIITELNGHRVYTVAFDAESNRIVFNAEERTPSTPGTSKIGVVDLSNSNNVTFVGNDTPYYSTIQDI